MLDKNPSLRVKSSELKSDPWLNEGYKVPLDAQEAGLMANLTDQELQSKGVSLQSMLIARKVAKKINQASQPIEIHKTRSC